MRVVKLFAESNGANQPAVNINRTAAHALRNAAAFFDNVAACAHKYAVPSGFAAGNADNFNIKVFDIVAVNNRFANTLHARAYIFHRHQRHIGSA